MLQIKKLLQIKYSCCKLNKVAANFQNELLQIKRILLQIKTSKHARALKEGGVGTRSFIFLSRKLLYFFLGLCDYSDKFPKMFCSSCGMECPSTANFCHQCGQQLNLSQVSNKAASSVDKEKLLKKYSHQGYPYTALIMCASDCGSRCFKVLCCILSLILGASD